MEKGILYLVSTPIGNLEDISFRAIRILKEVHLIAAEDTRTTSILLKHYNISTPMLSYHKFNEIKRASELIDKLDRGENIAVVSDAGTPAISDPSQIIVQEAIKNDIKVVPIPGACALLSALISSGISTDKFTFVGFLPNRKKDRISLLTNLKNRQETIVCFEAPHRLKSALLDIKEVFGNRKIAIAKEITKLYENFYRGKIEDILNNFSKVNLKGEFTIIIEGKCDNPEIADAKILSALKKLVNEKNYSKSKAVKQISQKFNLERNRIYRLSLKI